MRVYSIFCSLKVLKRREVCMSAFWRYLPFSVLGSKYLRSRRDERFACPRSGNIFHFLFWGASTLVLFEGPEETRGPEEMRGLRVRVPEICCIFCFGDLSQLWVS
ncbi:uncharacterized protein LACBIDRAFT_328755 [Laccaria bicolor S238N-H82]|uniref:Predicted protein n=1 Tax=Laccaria bicolor (strain S238N-H82 / ATCC MYA-4686) TaxID=486041 RepID=B0DFW4_LACBS|nr:uncharacterized protein LACBIDRAFT_328755 [Laccaria bicolor S238N-H82]EDR06533.1 predicted protein [Laccaria bicolor S238N-H82]|eukprot:XP_001882905.1 predicted protein [Laccaria bicolor S238N-H82]